MLCLIGRKTRLSERTNGSPIYLPDLIPFYLYFLGIINIYHIITISEYLHFVTDNEYLYKVINK